MTKPIVITGYPYAYPHYFKVFEYAENKNELVFILPRHWEAKEGKIKVDLEKRGDFKIYGARTFSYGGKSVWRGLLKGWMPSVFILLPYLCLKYRSKILFTCLEPNLLSTLYNGFFAKLFGYKNILFTWQNVSPEKRAHGLKLEFSNLLVKLNLSLADGVICGNKKAAEIVHSYVADLPTLVCPLSGVDVEKFKPGIISNWREKLNIKNDEKPSLFYGALEKRKGVDILIDAFSKLATENWQPKAKLIIVGTGPEERNLKLQVAGYKLQDKIIFLDWMPNNELPALLNAVDAFIYPSRPVGGWEEQFGYAMAEASACGLPVVATKTGSIDEVVVDGKSGILVEPNNAEQLAEALNKILSNQELAKRMGKFGREYVVKNFSHPVIAGKITEFLKTYENK